MTSITEANNIQNDYYSYPADYDEGYSWDNPDLEGSLASIFPPVDPASIAGSPFECSEDGLQDLDPMALEIYNTPLEGEGAETLLNLLGLPEAEARLNAYLETTPADEAAAGAMQQEVLDAYGRIFERLLDLESTYQDIPELAAKCQSLRQALLARLRESASDERSEELVNLITEDLEARENGPICVAEPIAEFPADYDVTPSGLEYRCVEAPLVEEEEAAPNLEPEEQPPVQEEPAEQAPPAPVISNYRPLGSGNNLSEQDITSGSQAEAVLETGQNYLGTLQQELFSLVTNFTERAFQRISRATREKQPGEVIPRRFWPF